MSNVVSSLNDLLHITVKIIRNVSLCFGFRKPLPKRSVEATPVKKTIQRSHEKHEYLSIEMKVKCGSYGRKKILHRWCRYSLNQRHNVWWRPNYVSRRLSLCLSVLPWKKSIKAGRQEMRILPTKEVLGDARQAEYRNYSESLHDVVAAVNT